MTYFTESEPVRGNETTKTLTEQDQPAQADSYTQETLFDDLFEEVDKLSDQGVATYAGAMQMLGITPPEYHTPTSPGVSVSLAEREAAVTQLMNGFAANNRTAGARMSSSAPLNRYSNPRQVLEGMERKAESYRLGENRAIEALAKTAALSAIGFSDQEVLASRVGIQRDLNAYRRKGPEATKARNKQKNMVLKTTKKVLGQK